MEADCKRSENSPAEQQVQGAETTDGSCARSISLCGKNMAELQNVGKVEISDDATLEDLKTQVKCFHWFVVDLSFVISSMFLRLEGLTSATTLLFSSLLRSLIRFN